MHRPSNAAESDLRNHPYRRQAERVLESVNYCSVIEDVDPASSLVTCANCGEEAYFKLFNLCVNCDGVG